MVVLGICLFVVLALGQLAIFVRLSPLQVLVDERTARQRVQERRGDAEATEGAALLRGLRTLHKDQTEIVRRERATSDVLRAQINAERVALQARCKELDVERLALVGTPSHEQRAALPKGERAQGENPAALGPQEETKRERPTALPTTPGDIADYRELVAATAAVDVDAEDNEQTTLWSSSALTTALEAGAGGATRPPQATPRAVRPVVVAPPASAPPLPSAEAAIKAAGLGRRPQRGPVATPPAPLQRTETLVGMPAVRPQEPVGDASAASLPDREDTRETFESLPLFEPEPGNARRGEQEAST